MNNNKLDGSPVAQAVRCSPPTAALESRVCISVIPCVFHGGRIGDWVGVSPVLSYIKFHSPISLHSYISFHQPL